MFGNKATWLAGGLTLALSLLVAGFLLGQALTGRPETGPDVAGRDQLPATVVSVLRSELAEARRLHWAALDTAGAGVETARQELVLAAQAASAHAALLGRDLDAAQLRIADLEAEARTAKAKAGGLAEQLVEIPKAHATALEKVRAEAETRRLELLPVAETAAEKAATRKQELDKALGQIVQLEATLQWERLAKEMEQARQAQDVSHRNAPMPAAVSSKQATSTPDNPDVASGQSSELRPAHNNFITLYQQGRYAEAEPYAREAVRLRTQEFGPNDPTTAASINNLAVIYQAQGRYAEAEPLYQRSLAIKEKILGSEHPDVARGLNNLAALYHARGHYMQAEPL